MVPALLFPRGFQALIEIIRLYSFENVMSTTMAGLSKHVSPYHGPFSARGKRPSSGKEMSTFPVSILYPMYIREYSYSSNLTYG